MLKLDFSHLCERKFRHGFTRYWISFVSVVLKLKPWHTISYAAISKIRTTAQKTKFSIKKFLSKYDQNRSFPRIWSHLLNKFLMKNFIFCAVNPVTLMNDLENIPFLWFVIIIGYGNDKFDGTKNRKVLMSTIKFIKDSQRFEEQLFW